MNHTTNLIDVKIRLRIALIEVCLPNFFFDVLSVFKGRLRSNLAMIRDQSRLNLIAIESRTQGDHEELKIFLQNCLISSRFNQELKFKEEEHRFIGKIVVKIVDYSI